MPKFLSLAMVFLIASPVLALSPAEIVVIANRNSPASKRVARHYLEVRKVPAENLIELDLPTAEEMSRSDYDRKLADPLREALKDRMDKLTCLLTIYGVPLRVQGVSPTDEEKAELGKVREKLAEVKAQTEAEKKEKSPNEARLQVLQREQIGLRERELILSQAESQAAVDSELMLLWWPRYSLARWQPNPLNWQFPPKKMRPGIRTLMTSRIDGPSEEIAMRLIDDAIAVEQVGLKGNVAIDARGIGYDPKSKSEGGYGYSGYDESMRETARLLKAAGMTVKLDDKPDLFADNSCPDTAIYCGWYALSNYKPCCTFVKGAVAWHLASSEAVSLKKGSYWCPNLLKAGVAATLGPVGEPYTIGFPKPAEFFGFLATGEYTLVEAYSRTVHFTSWMTTLVGDPLYNPYRKNPPLKSADIKTSPEKSVFIYR